MATRFPTLDKIGDIGGQYLHSRFGNTRKKEMLEAANTAANIYYKKIPNNLPQPVKDKAKREIFNMAEKSQFSQIRKYIKGLSD